MSLAREMLVKVNDEAESPYQGQEGEVVDRIYKWEGSECYVMLGIALFDVPSPAIVYISPEDLTEMEAEDDEDEDEEEDEEDGEESEEG